MQQFPAIRHPLAATLVAADRLAPMDGQVIDGGGGSHSDCLPQIARDMFYAVVKSNSTIKVFWFK